MKPAVSVNCIDLKRGYVGVAFLNREQHAEVEGHEAHKLAWNGALDYIGRHVRSLFVEAYKDCRRYVHTEVCFYCSDYGLSLFGADAMIACGTRNTDTSITSRVFNDKYTWLWLRATPPQISAMFAFFVAQLNKPYDTDGSMRVYTNPRPTDGRAWYCSEIVMCALQLLPCPVLHELRANCVDIDDVYDAVSRSPLFNSTATCLAPRQLKSAWSSGSTVTHAWKAKFVTATESP